ncbi:ABC transporter, ATP-binding protein [Oesophagostomum dentatum]|uniref:ABC transporter, ATP-binding protein n=1 Tax=Oesophagostomum dentatum TaxID=61180 RepID=A0A0B1TU17_OESDE|nr:ABC transporter, ATP-binding protein [Oesophagostomum dentatum]
MTQAYIYGGVFAFSQSLIFFMYAIAFWIGSVFVDDKSMQPIDVYRYTAVTDSRVFFAFMFCGQTVGNVSSFIPDVVKARLSASLLFYLIEHPTVIDSLSENGHKRLSNKKTNKNPERIELRGQTRNNSCIGGTFRTVDGENIENINIRSLREQVCIVSQEPTLFDCTVKENICYGLEQEPTYERIVEAAKMANIHNFILSLPKGYDTRVGEKGTQLSGGQKQRIAIARALIRDPPVLLLDEATSALDTESEKIVQEALEVARRGRTCIVIAHRLSTIQNSDVIVVVQEGRATDKGELISSIYRELDVNQLNTGTHEYLLSRSELYKKLCETQRLQESQ